MSHSNSPMYADKYGTKFERQDKSNRSTVKKSKTNSLKSILPWKRSRSPDMKKNQANNENMKSNPHKGYRRSFSGGIESGSNNILARSLEMMQSIFPSWEVGSLALVLEAHGYVMEDAITSVLRIEEEEAPILRDSLGMPIQNYVVKNPLPDDFLRVPELKHEYVEEEFEDMDQNINEIETLQIADSVDIESSIAEDDGTLYGKEFNSQSNDQTIEERSDSFAATSPKFEFMLPRTSSSFELKNEEPDQLGENELFQRMIIKTENCQVPNAFTLRFQHSNTASRDSIFVTARSNVIKRSKLDITGAEDRIRHREPHKVFDCLAKASTIYRTGIITSSELDTLRALILNRMQPTKMLLDTSVNIKNEFITDYEWNSLVLKCKEIRQALSIRIIRSVPNTSGSGHTEYEIRVSDLETGVVIITKRRYREFYKLHRKLSRLSERISDLPFPTRRNNIKISALQVSRDRIPVLQSYLRVVASLVTPSPITFLRGCALKQLQQFLNIPSPESLEKRLTKPLFRTVRVYIYHIVNDLTSPEGKACRKFSYKITQNLTSPNALSEISEFLDSVQNYMMEHRLNEMIVMLKRLEKQLDTENSTSQFNGVTKLESVLNKNNTTNPTTNDENSQLTTLNSTASCNNSSSCASGVSNYSLDSLTEMISNAVRHEIEDCICIPILPALQHDLVAKMKQKEYRLRCIINMLRYKSQSEFDIPLKMQSKSNWWQVIAIMNHIDTMCLPADKLSKLVEAANQIHVVYKLEQTAHFEDMIRKGEVDSSAVLADSDVVLSGDDFLPIFIYVIVNSSIEYPLVLMRLLTVLCDPEKRMGESGYYLACYEAALEHIFSNTVQ